MKKIAVFASGNGSNFNAIVSSLKEQVKLVVCDRPGAYVIQRAKQWGVETLVISPADVSSKLDFERRILSQLQADQVEFLVLAGYMRLLGPTLLQAYYGRVINIHPSLLPAFPGKDAIYQALKHGVKVTGVTVHFVDQGMDTGPIIYQQAVNICMNDTEATLAKKINTIEHQIFPKVIQACINNQIRLVNGKVKYDKGCQL